MFGKEEVEGIFWVENNVWLMKKELIREQQIVQML
jgi:hypothetical protein